LCAGLFNGIWTDAIKYSATADNPRQLAWKFTKQGVGLRMWKALGHQMIIEDSLQLSGQSLRTVPPWSDCMPSPESELELQLPSWLMTTSQDSAPTHDPCILPSFVKKNLLQMVGVVYISMFLCVNPKKHLPSIIAHHCFIPGYKPMILARVSTFRFTKYRRNISLINQTSYLVRWIDLINT